MWWNNFQCTTQARVNKIIPILHPGQNKVIPNSVILKRCRWRVSVLPAGLVTGVETQGVRGGTLKGHQMLPAPKNATTHPMASQDWDLLNATGGSQGKAPACSYSLIYSLFLTWNNFIFCFPKHSCVTHTDEHMGKGRKTMSGPGHGQIFPAALTNFCFNTVQIKIENCNCLEREEIWAVLWKAKNKIPQRNSAQVPL